MRFNKWTVKIFPLARKLGITTTVQDGLLYIVAGQLRTVQMP